MENKKLIKARLEIALEHIEQTLKLISNENDEQEAQK